MRPHGVAWISCRQTHAAVGLAVTFMTTERPRLRPGERPEAVAVRQLRALAPLLPAEPVPLFVFDARFNPAALTAALAGVSVAILVRFRGDRVFFRAPPPHAGPGRPRRHGSQFRCAIEATWGTPDVAYSEEDSACGRVEVRCWAGLLAGAISMALGEWLSVRSSRELYETRLRIEREELERAPEEEGAELALIYRAKGLPPDEARALAARLAADPNSAMDTLAREELGIDPEGLGGSAGTAALTSFVLFALGAIVPVAPYFVVGGLAAVTVSVVLSGAALFAIGAGTTLFTGGGVLFSGSRQLGFGLAAAAVTYGAGRLVGTGLGL